MASAKFLEEALSTDVDESAVNAIVGSLETQLVTSTPVIKVSNGGGATTVNSLMNQEVTKSITTSTLLPVNVVTSNTVAPQVTTQQQQHTQSAVPPAAYINQVTTNQVTSNQTTNIPSLTKTHEPVKIIYPTVGQVIATTGVANANNKLSFPAQTVGQLANGTLGITSQAVLQTTSNVVSNVGSVSETGSQTVASVNKQTGTALVIKTSVAPSGMVSVPMSVPVSVAGNAVSTALQGKAGVTSTIVPSNVQILNVNTMRPGTPVTGQQAGKQVAPRVVIGQHMLGTRPGAPGITLQTLHGLQPGTQGHILLKTESGQYQLLRVGPPPTAGTPGTAVTPNSIAGNAVVAAPSPGTTYRLASVPAVSRLNTQFTGPPLATLRKSVQTVAATITTATTTPVTVTAAVSTAPTPPVTTVQTVQTPTPRQTTDNTKEKCRKFLANLLELSSREPKAVERNVRTLIQELIDTKVEPEEFCDRLERLLNASPQPCLIGFLKKSLPLLRQSLVTKELVIEGIKPPPANVVFPVTSATPVVTQQNQLRPTVSVTPTTVPVAAVTASTQVRVMTPIPAATTTVPRPAQPVQQRLIRPVTTVVRSPTGYTVKSTVAVTGIRPTVPTVQKPPITTTVVKTVTTTTQGKTVNTTTTVNKAIVPSFVPKPVTKEKEKKTFSSAGYTGDDDINDVAAMGGVNLAEESQRILGSTEFVGTQIRSCKDEVFLHMTPLQQRIKQIVSNYGLEEPNQEVAALISHAAQERLKNLVEKLAVIAEHRIDLIKVDPRYEVTQDVRAQLKFLEDLDKVERRRHEEQERELLLRAAKSRAKTEDPEQAKLKAKAKEMQRAEMEELRQREANLTALQAIGPRKKPKLDAGASASSPGSNTGLNTSATGINRQMPMRPRLKRVNFRDLLFFLEQEKETCRSTMLYKSYLK
ncbi:transcription initiation factor TFIID subunit 4 isoform X1 [Apis mellifera caucasica]|uniref:Transcription initiation factor TFIID subunit 4 isoform X1 n=2 Tax=Apis mellifera TaxID=7460 RepID=A0A7M7IIC7_APIME|nr:transcription initiation factor TFIID subunit 4 isoform X1 [Apis mellifera]KAG6799536.1 transcription initiation factor TFIID subunit 4 isoform X1 [Apis mellifera caucasica]KAG9434436.1 transcription initiation factor TFIID subunit 4 isoform X1 [Apis mellifera carnica]|eukprot:XP_016768590.1 transcription initiation factor TFIID subunit 4 isoform X1 [Apis mellifera]